MTCATCGLSICSHRDDEWKRHPVLTPDDIRVIRDRHYGWESASPALLAKVFRVSHQRISAVLRANPGVSQERRA